MTRVFIVILGVSAALVSIGQSRESARAHTPAVLVTGSVR